MCGGTLIHRDLVLTTASCLARTVGTDMKLEILLGISNTEDGFDYEQKVLADAEDVRIHPNYGGIDPSDPNLIVRYDVGVVKSRSWARYGENIQPICLPTGRYKLKNCAVAGMGLTKPTDKLPSDRLYSLPISPCKITRPVRDPVTGFLACPKEGHPGSACPGDAGGPLVCRARDQSDVSFVQRSGMFLLGILSRNLAGAGKDTKYKCQRGDRWASFFTKVFQLKKAIIQMSRELVALDDQANSRMK